MKLGKNFEEFQENKRIKENTGIDKFVNESSFVDVVRTHKNGVWLDADTALRVLIDVLGEKDPNVSKITDKMEKGRGMQELVKALEDNVNAVEEIMKADNWISSGIDDIYSLEPFDDSDEGVFFDAKPGRAADETFKTYEQFVNELASGDKRLFSGTVGLKPTGKDSQNSKGKYRLSVIERDGHKVVVVETNAGNGWELTPGQWRYDTIKDRLEGGTEISVQGKDWMVEIPEEAAKEVIDFVEG